MAVAVVVVVVIIVIAVTVMMVVRLLDRPERQARVAMRAVMVMFVRPRTMPVDEGAVHTDQSREIGRVGPAIGWATRSAAGRGR
jgi:hypothetical protein